MGSYRIPFNKPTFTGNELKYIREAIGQNHISGDGPFTKKCQSFLEHALGVHKVLLTTSCTHALEMAALLLEIQPGDEVIVPSFTFVSTINAFVLRGARPIFIDIRRDTLNLDEARVEPLITARTRAIVAVHYAGVGCEMDTLEDIVRRHGDRIAVVEDNAHGLFGRYKGKSLGTFGVFGAQSFHETKNFTCGEGGALIINNPRYVSRAEVIREKGTNRSRFYRGEVDKYTWVGLVSSYLPSDILAAFLCAQLEERERIQARRQRAWEYYRELLQNLSGENSVQLPAVPAHCEHPYHMFYILLPSRDQRPALINFLNSRRIHSVFHYVPLHLSEMGRTFGGAEGDCPATEDVSERLLRLPFYTGITPQEQDEVVASIDEFFRGRGSRRRRSWEKAAT
jgi:dTDP-4-amino-4,6-dideoxygalactose transaminase